MADIKDIFTKKDLAEVEAERNKADEVIRRRDKETFLLILKAYQDLVEKGEVVGLAVAAATEDSLTHPKVITTTKEASLKMSFLIDCMKDQALGACLVDYNLAEYEEVYE